MERLSAREKPATPALASRDACPSGPPRSRPGRWMERGSRPKRLERRRNQRSRGIRITPDPSAAHLNRDCAKLRRARRRRRSVLHNHPSEARRTRRASRVPPPCVDMCRQGSCRRPRAAPPRPQRRRAPQSPLKSAPDRPNSMCGRPRPCKKFLTLCCHLSGAVMCPAFVCGA